jgi:LacI family transcriptional regulator
VSTIKDVARLAGVGVATASRALSGRGPVSGSALARVQAAVQDLGYRPSSIARALTLQQSGAIGVYVPMFDGYFYSGIVSTIDGVLRGVGRHMVAANGCGGGTPRQQAIDGVEFLIGCDCDGLLVCCNSLTDDDLVRLLARAPRTVVVNRELPGLAERCFSVDHHGSGRRVAQALLGRGHRVIATICGPRDAPDNHARMQGFTDELARHGLAVRPAHSQDATFDQVSGDAAMRRLLAARHQNDGEPFTAVFAANDLMAMAAVSRIVQSGLQVPDDISVIGYDDADFAAYTSPPLTTLRMPSSSVASNACRHVLNLCYGLALPVSREFQPEVIWRQSVADGPHPPMQCNPP